MATLKKVLNYLTECVVSFSRNFKKVRVKNVKYCKILNSHMSHLKCSGQCLVSVSHIPVYSYEQRVQTCWLVQ